MTKAGRFVLGIVLYLQYLYVLGLPNTFYGYCYFPNTIQYNNFFEENSGEKGDLLEGPKGRSGWGHHPYTLLTAIFTI